MRMSQIVGVVILAMGLHAVPAAAATCDTANVALGGTWTRVDCNALSANGLNPTSIAPRNRQPINAHDTLVGFCDCDNINGTGFCFATMTDNAGNVWQRFPVTPGHLTHGNPNIWDVSWWYVLDAKPKATGYQMSCTITEVGGGVLQDIDVSIMVFRQSTGRAARGVSPPCGNPISLCGTSDAATATIGIYGPLASGNGPCPCPTVALPLSSPVSGALLLGLAQMNGAPRSTSGLAGCDGDGVTNVPFFYTACAVASAAFPPGQVMWSWTDNTPGDNYVEGLVAILPQ